MVGFELGFSGEGGGEAVGAVPLPACCMILLSCSFSISFLRSSLISVPEEWTSFKGCMTFWPPVFGSDVCGLVFSVFAGVVSGLGSGLGAVAAGCVSGSVGDAGSGVVLWVSVTGLCAGGKLLSFDTASAGLSVGIGGTGASSVLVVASWVSALAGVVSPSGVLSSVDDSTGILFMDPSSPMLI